MKSKTDRKPQPLAAWATAPQAQVRVPTLDLIALLVPDLGWHCYRVGGTDPIQWENPEGEE